MSIRRLLSDLKWRIFPIKSQGRGNVISIKSSKLGKVRINIKGIGNNIFIDENVLLYNLNIVVSGNNNIIHISKDCRIYNLNLDIKGNGSTFSLGENAGIRQANIVIWENQSVVIDKDAMLSYGINIRTSDSHAIYDVVSNNRINLPKSVHIGEHAWLAQNVTLLKGADIGSNTIVGFGSICSKVYPDNCIIAGCPAKIIKTDVRWGRELNP